MVERYSGYIALGATALVSIVLVTGVLLAPRARLDDRRSCVNQLRIIDDAKWMWALQMGVTNQPISPKLSDLQPYLGQDKLGAIRYYCPADPKRSFESSYIINNLGTAPQCRFRDKMTNHVLGGP